MMQLMKSGYNWRNFYMLKLFFLAKTEKIYIAAKHVLKASNVNIFNSYPWRRVSFKQLDDSLANRNAANRPTYYFLNGCVYALIIFAYEVIPKLIEKQYDCMIDHLLP